MTRGIKKIQLMDELKGLRLIGEGVNVDGGNLSPRMRLECSLTILRAWKVACKYGFTVADPSHRIVSLCKGGRFVIHDCETFVPLHTARVSLNTMFVRLLGPLLVSAMRPELTSLSIRGEYLTIREYLTLFSVFFRQVPERVFIRIANSRVGYLLCLGMYREALRLFLFKKYDRKLLLQILSRIENLLGAIKLKTLQGHWTGYYQGFDLDSLTTTDELDPIKWITARHKAVFGVLDNMAPATVLDISSNQGLFSLLSLRAGHKVLAIDNDIGAIDGLYELVKNRSLDITPVVLDFFDLNQRASQIFKSDYVLALGFVHHLYLVEFCSWGEIARRLGEITKKTLITEFKVSTGASHAERLTPTGWEEGYDIDAFLRALREHFDSVEIHDYDNLLSSQRRLIICNK